ncbi:MAG TPA: histidine kinase [Burkholderiaceae bacterium]
MQTSASTQNNAAAGEREKHLAALVHHLLRTEESEKAALARQLHDELGALLTVASLDVATVAHKLKQSEPELAARLLRALDKIKQAAAFKRDVVESMRPSMLDGLGLSTCLDQHVLEFGKRTGLQVSADIRRDCDRLGPEAAIALFRIAESALDLVPQGAHAGELRISLLERDGGAALSIEVGGADVRVDELALSAMRERAAAHGGKLTVARPKAAGIAVELWLPLLRVPKGA